MTDTPTPQPTAARTRIITPQQLADGFRILGYGARSVWRGEYRVIRQLDDGNYLVHEPAPESRS